MDLMKAISYATEKHDGQRRKLDNLPYIMHPYRVAMLLLKENHREEVVIAGLLHDVVEDTDGTLEEIGNNFGVDVARLVSYASEPNKELSWEERKRHTIETIKHAPIDAKLVVCADKVDNLNSLLENEQKIGSRIWDSFKRNKSKQQWYYSSVYNSLVYNVKEDERPKIFDHLKHLLNQFIDATDIPHK